MKRIALTLVSAAAVLVLVPMAGATAKGKPSYAEIRKKYEEAKTPAFFDCSYYVDATKLDSRWKIKTKPFANMTLKSEAQMTAAWSASAAGGGKPAIYVMIRKWTHKERVPGGTSTMSITFPNTGDKVDTAAAKKIHEGCWKNWLEGASEVDKKASTKPRKKKNGPATLYAAAVGNAPYSVSAIPNTDGPGEPERHRKEFYCWTAPNITWMAVVTYSSQVVNNEKILEKGVKFMKSIKEMPKKHRPE